MTTSNATVPISPNITWVGVCDPELKDFHGFETPLGSSYNSYLVRGSSKIALVDVANEGFVPELLSKISSQVELAEIDYIVVNHIEPDHGGGLRLVKEALPNAEILCSSGAAKGIAAFHGADLAVTVVSATDLIDLGGVTLQFLPMPMVHWPDSMFTYVAESKTLLPNDAFGQHIGTSETRWADEYGFDKTMDAVNLYYANILMPLSTTIRRALDKIVELGWEIETIAPSHGLAWRGEGVARIIERYEHNLSAVGDGSVALVYTTAWHSTEKMAGQIAELLRARGVTVHVLDLETVPWSAITQQVMESSVLVAGSPTLHNSMFYRMAGYLHYLTVLKPSLKLAAAFGSYGWSSGATKQMRQALEAAGVEMPLEDLQIKYRPLAADEETIVSWVDELVKAVV